ncbi:hypothetical protein B0H13DRAFT_1882647 [Mycena leptocephala]|nr:hypothetical protein B0H13DRAFT_1882647 [Mycena leptocephala]
MKHAFLASAWLCTVPGQLYPYPYLPCLQNGQSISGDHPPEMCRIVSLYAMTKRQANNVMKHALFNHSSRSHIHTCSYRNLTSHGWQYDSAVVHMGDPRPNPAAISALAPDDGRREGARKPAAVFKPTGPYEKAVPVDELDQKVEGRKRKKERLVVFRWIHLGRCPDGFELEGEVTVVERESLRGIDSAEEPYDGVDLKEVVGRIFMKDHRTLALNEVNFVIIKLVNFVVVPRGYAGV